MSSERNDRLDPKLPTLIVQSGNTRRKHRPLDREVLVLGRAAGCDVGLESPDVAPVHCVIVRAADGWRVHDCTGKGGTRVNGLSIYDAALTDEDVLQIGSFSFVLHLPPEHRPLGGAAASPEDAALRRAWRSRHNLARLALRLRGRVAEMTAAAAERDNGDATARQAELDRQEEELSALQKEVDARFAELRQTAQELAEQKAALEERGRQAEQELADRRRELEAGAADASHGLEIRADELRRYALHLRRLRGRLNDHEESLTARWEEWLREQQEASVALERQREKMQREESLLRDQRAEIVRLMAEMRQVRKQPEGLVESLREEIERLRGGLAERESAAAAAREEACRSASEAEELRARLDGQKGAAAAPEAGLQRFHAELDAGRRVLDEQIREVQARFAELDRVAHDAENHIAQERARIAQEREELERLRGDLWPADGQSPGAETVVDMPSPLRQILENTPPAEAPAQAP